MEAVAVPRRAKEIELWLVSSGSGPVLRRVYWQATPFTANEVGEALVVLFQVPLNPIPE